MGVGDRRTKHRVLGRNGYTLCLSTLGSAEVNRVRAELTVAPFNPMAKHFNTQPETFTNFKYSARHLYVPRFYGVSRYGLPLRNDLPMGTEIDLLFHGSMRPAQQAVVAKTTSVLRDGVGGGLLQLPCGFGKTIIALYILAQMRRKVLIIVHKEFLLNQWVERIDTFLPTARVGRIQGPKVVVDDVDIVIGMLQSLTQRKYDSSTFETFGLTIYDECHHLGAASFSRCMSIVRTRMVLGLSATPDRADGLRRVFEWHLGDVIVKIEPGTTTSSSSTSSCTSSSTSSSTNKVGTVRVIQYDDDDIYEHDATQETMMRFADGHVEKLRDTPMFRHRLVEHICTSPGRIQLLVNEMVRTVEADANRRVLVLSERIAHLHALAAELESRGVGPDSYGFYVGGRKQRDLDEAATKTYIFGSFQMASEGMDIPVLNTLVFATPKGDITQTIGRIMRKKHAATLPLVIDVRDVRLTRLASSFSRRKSVYRKLGFTFEGERDTSAFRAASVGTHAAQPPCAKGGHRAVPATIAFR